MVQLSNFLVSLLLLTSSLGTPLKRTVAQIEADIASITTQVTALHSALQAFPATGLAGASVFVVKQLRYIGPISPFAGHSHGCNDLGNHSKAGSS
jgi:hypothetical protein